MTVNSDWGLRDDPVSDTGRRVATRWVAVAVLAAGVAVAFAALVVGTDPAVLAAAVAVAVMAAVVLVCASAAAVPQVDTVRVAVEPMQVIQDLHLLGAGIHGVTPRRDGVDAITFERNAYPTWAIVAAIVLFPVGLLALLARDTSTLTAVATTDGAATTVRLGGNASRTLRAEVRRHLDTYPTPAAR